MANWKPEVEMPKQSPEERIKNFEEVAKGYTEEMAIEEAERCLTCPNPQCVKGCPVDIDIPGFIAFIAESKSIYTNLRWRPGGAMDAIIQFVCFQHQTAIYVESHLTPLADDAIGMKRPLRPFGKFL